MAKNNTPKDPAPKPIDEAAPDGVAVAEEVDEILPEEATGALVRLESVNIGELLATGKGVEEILAEVRRQTVDIVPDLTTEKGRKQIRALAYRVSRTRALMDEKRLEHTKSLRDQLSKMNENGKTLLEGLATIRDDVRRPLTEWEELDDLWSEALLEDARREAEAREAAERFAAEVQQRIDTWRGMPAVVVGMSVAEVEATLAQYEQMTINPDLFGDRVEEAAAVRAEALAKVEGYLKLQRKAEELEAQAAAAQAEKQAAIDAAAEAARQQEQERADRAARIDGEIQKLRQQSLAAASTMSSGQIDALIGEIERMTFDPGFYGERLGEAYASRVVLAGELRTLRDGTLEHEEREREAAALREREAEEQRRRQLRDQITGRIQGIQTQPLLRASACGTADMLQALRDDTAADELNPDDFQHPEDPHGELWSRALESRATALAKLDELIAAKRQAEADAAEAARLRQEAADRAAREERERQAEQARAKQAENLAHRRQVRGNAAEAISRAVGNSITIDQCTTIVHAIEGGQIPHVSITF